METTQNLTDTPTAVPQLGRSVTIQRAAEILGVSRRTVYYRISEGVLQTIRTRGGSQRVIGLCRDLQAYILPDGERTTASSPNPGALCVAGRCS